jgi:hypothetical protein
MKNRPFCSLSILLACALSAQAGEALNLVFQGDAAKDLSSNRPADLHNVIVMQAGSKGYADLSGTSAIIIPGDQDLSFSKGEKFWAEMWLNPQGRGKVVSLIVKGSGANYRIGLQPKLNPFFSYYSGGEWRTLVANESLEPDQWQHLAVAFDSSAGVAAIFLNGKVIGVAEGLPNFQSKGDEPLYIGGGLGKTEGEIVGFRGLIGPVKISHEFPARLPSPPKLAEQAFEPAESN